MVGVGEDLFDLSPPQFKALTWISNVDRRQVEPSKGAELFQQYVRAVILHEIEQGRCHKIIQWVAGFHECDWFDIYCHCNVSHPYLQVNLDELEPSSLVQFILCFYHLYFEFFLSVLIIFLNMVINWVEHYPKCLTEVLEMPEIAAIDTIIKSAIPFREYYDVPMGGLPLTLDVASVFSNPLKSL